MHSFVREGNKMRVIAMMNRVLTELMRDKRTVALMFAAPLLMLTLMYVLFRGVGDVNADLAVQSVDAQLVSAMEVTGMHIHHVAAAASAHDDKSQAQRMIRQNDYAGYLTEHGNTLTLTLANADQAKSALITRSIASAQARVAARAAASTIASQRAALYRLETMVGKLHERIRSMEAMSGSHPGPEADAGPDVAPGHRRIPRPGDYHVSVRYLYGDEHTNLFDSLVPVLMGFVVFFFVFLISGIALLHERTTGTLSRLLATEIRRWKIIDGYLAGYGLVAIVQTVVVVAYTMLVFRTQILGCVGTVVLLNLLIAATALTLGLLVSTFAATEFQMMQFIPLIVIPQIFFSGIVPLDAMPAWLHAVSRIMPLYWGAHAMGEVVSKGAGLTRIAPDLGALAGFVVVFLGLNLLAMRRYRRV